MVKRFFRQVVPILLALGLLWYVLSGVPLTDLANQFRKADFRWVLLAAFFILLHHISRAIRWQLALQALGYKPSVFRITVAMLAGVLANMIIPGAGEVTRCGTIQRTDGIPVAQGFGSVVAERIVDLIALLLMVGLTLLLEFQRIGQYIVELLAPVLNRSSDFSRSGLAWILGGVILVICIIGYRLIRSEAFWQHHLIQRIASIVRDMKRGFLSIQQLKSPGLFILMTLVSYVSVFLTTYTLFFASPSTISLPPTAALTLLTAGSLGGLAVPTQGGLGTYHFLVSRALTLYGLTMTDGVVIATFLHAVQMGFSLLLSGVSFLLIPFLITKRSQKPAEHLVKDN